MRVSKSYVVNINYIDSFDNHTLYIDVSEIPIGEVYREEFFTKYAGGFLNSD
nr:LytTR family transcriptional regulator DNA-binding domain-containing protein [Chryseobacterium sp. Bi04]